MPDIASRKRGARGHAERAAINTPIQGSAADVVMKAMMKIHVNERLKEMGYKLLMQVRNRCLRLALGRVLSRSLAHSHARSRSPSLRFTMK